MLLLICYCFQSSKQSLIQSLINMLKAASVGTKTSVFAVVALQNLVNGLCHSVLHLQLIRTEGSSGKVEPRKVLSSILREVWSHSMLLSI